MKKTCFFTVLLFYFLFLNMVSCEKTDHIHVFDEWKQISESTCSEQGEAVRNCTVKGCDYSEKKSTDLKKHDYQDNIVAPTKTKDGYTAHICKNCSHSFTDTYVPAIGSSNLQYDYIETDGNVTCVITGIGSCTDTNVYIPSYIGKYPVTAIDTGAFKGITTIKSVVIPSGITEIGERAFSGCSGLETITISNTIKKIKDEAFLACESLNGVYISDLSSWCNIQFGATTSNPLYYAKKLFLNDQHITSLIIPENVTVINHFAFINCTYISEITIHNMVTYIGCQSFYNCGVTTVIIPDSVNTIEAAAFAACVELTDIKLPATLTSIEMGAFQGCLALKSIDIPKSVITIGNQAFKGCKNLVSIIIPQNVIGIDSGAFEGCESLKSIIFKNTNNWRSYRNYDLQGTPIDVSDPTQNAIIFIQANTFTSWKRQ